LLRKGKPANKRHIRIERRNKCDITSRECARERRRGEGGKEYPGDWIV
jgi:hypothetical protein